MLQIRKGGFTVTDDDGDIANGVVSDATESVVISTGSGADCVRFTASELRVLADLAEAETTK